jgi:hypothetical protein
VIRELRARDPLLFWTGAAQLLALLVVTLISISDTRLILGINPWIKPMKFLLSSAIFMWTVAWFMPETQNKPAQRGLVRWTIAAAMTIELVLIIMQSARGTTSHFNVTTGPLNAAVFTVMGITITISTLAMMLFIWILRRDTPPHRAGYLWGVRLGVTMFVIACWLGFVIVANNGHTVPRPDGGPGLPFVNWSTTGGDLRVMHFFGMHGMQALPILGFLLDRAGAHAARNVVMATGIAWLAAMSGLLLMALQGRPLLAL